MFGYWWACFKAKRRGRKDGRDFGKANEALWTEEKDKNGQPLRNKDGWIEYYYPQYEVELVKGYNSGIQKKIIEKWESRDQKFKGKYCTALRNKNQAETGLREQDAEYKTVKGNYEGLEEQKSRFVPPPTETKWWYIPLLFFMGLLEIPFNAVVFRPFREAEIVNYVIASIIGIGLVVLGHFLGKAIKERKFLRTSILIILPLAVLWAIAYIRKEYLVGIEAKISPESAIWIFWLIGVLLFTAATMFSLSQHEGRSDAQTVLRNLKDTRKKLERIEHNKKVLQQKEDFWAKKVVEIDADRVGFFRENHCKVNQYIESAKALIIIYRAELLRQYMKCKKPETEQPKPPRAYLAFVKGILVEGNPENLNWECNLKKEGQA